MGCAASAEGPQPPNQGGRVEDSLEKKDSKRAVEAPPENQQQGGAGDQSTPVVPTRPPETTPPVTVAVMAPPPTIAGYPVNTYTDGATRVAVKCVILSRQKCESVCRFLDTVRKARDRNGGVFRNPEEPLEVEIRRDIDTASAASGRSKMEPSMSAVHNNSVTGHGMNVSMAVHVGQAEALSPSPHGGLATVPDISSGNTPARNANVNEREKVPQQAVAGVTAGSPQQRTGGEPIPGSVDVDGAM